MADIRKVAIPGGGTYDLKTDDMAGATQSANGKSGAVPAPSAGDQGKYLRGDGTWDAAKADRVAYPLTIKINGGTGQEFDGSAGKVINLVQGDNVSISADDDGNITVSAVDTTYSEATSAAAGLMGAGDKARLDGLAVKASVSGGVLSLSL